MNDSNKRKIHIGYLSTALTGFLFLLSLSDSIMNWMSGDLDVNVKQVPLLLGILTLFLFQTVLILETQQKTNSALGMIGHTHTKLDQPKDILIIIQNEIRYPIEDLGTIQD